MDSLTSGQIHVGAGMDLPAWTAASLRPLWLNYDLSSVVSEIWWFIYSPFYPPPFHLKTSHGVSLRTHSIKIGVKNYSFWVTWWWRPHDPAIISFDALLACDGQTDGRTARHAIYVQMKIVRPYKAQARLLQSLNNLKSWWVTRSGKWRKKDVSMSTRRYDFRLRWILSDILRVLLSRICCYAWQTRPIRRCSVQTYACFSCVPLIAVIIIVCIVLFFSV